MVISYYGSVGTYFVIMGVWEPSMKKLALWEVGGGGGDPSSCMVAA